MPSCHCVSMSSGRRLNLVTHTHTWLVKVNQVWFFFPTHSRYLSYVMRTFSSGHGEILAFSYHIASGIPALGFLKHALVSDRCVRVDAGLD